MFVYRGQDINLAVERGAADDGCHYNIMCMPQRQTSNMVLIF